MDGIGDRLRARARQLDLNDSQVARRAGLDERRYHHYVKDRNEPDLATILRLCAILEITPNQLLGWEAMPGEAIDRGTIEAALDSTIDELSTQQLALLIRIARKMRV